MFHPLRLLKNRASKSEPKLSNDSRSLRMIKVGGWSWLPRHLYKNVKSKTETKTNKKELHKICFDLKFGYSIFCLFLIWWLISSDTQIQLYDLDYFYVYDRGGAAWQPMGVTGVNDGVGVNEMSITDLSEGARTPSR